MRGGDRVLTTVTLAAGPATFHTDVLRVDLASVWQDYDAHHQQEGACGKTEREPAKW